MSERTWMEGDIPVPLRITIAWPGFDPYGIDMTPGDMIVLRLSGKNLTTNIFRRRGMADDVKDAMIAGESYSVSFQESQVRGTVEGKFIEYFLDKTNDTVARFDFGTIGPIDSDGWTARKLG